MKKTLRKVDWLYESTAVTVYALAIIIMLVQVFSRYVLSSPMMWAEEFARLMFVWIVFIGAPIVIKRHGNIAVDYFIQYLPQMFRRKLKLVLYVIAAIFSLLIAYLGMNMVISHWHMTLNTLPFPQSVRYLPIMLGFLMMGINFMRVIPEVIRGEDE
ncbi:TRAP transporter small permease [Bacillus shivajii]|uniref:TRAP transporter small permease n=1 Tax=Bacillus shivajii TaxID=1983719 RepID=UPI001CF9D3B4|nr:TRAP transporter small permease [Bacillus shivajii]UCZ52908.1 TRAP transporter small permease [Bacillus shivajii]